MYYVHCSTVPIYIFDIEIGPNLGANASSAATNSNSISGAQFVGAGGSRLRNRVSQCGLVHVMESGGESKKVTKG